jgi:hypothetical protein
MVNQPKTKPGPYRPYGWLLDFDGPPLIEAAATVVLAIAWYFIVNQVPPNAWVPY